MHTIRRRSSLQAVLVAVVLASLGLLTSAPPNASAASLVLLHGTVTDVAGPAAGTEVTATASDGSTSSTVSTDASGAYALHVVPGDTYLQFSAGGGTLAVDHVDSLSAFTTGTITINADTQEDFIWPGPATAQVAVLNSTGNGVAGVTVNTPASGAGEASTLSDGTTGIQVDYAINVPAGPIRPNDAGGPPLTCATDATGHCSLPTVIGTDTFYSTDPYQVVPGDPSYPSLTASAEALITADPTAVTLTFVDASNAVLLHGTVSDVAGPAAGSVVTGSSTGAISVATTDATGAYALHVLPSDLDLAFTAGNGTLAVDHLARLSAQAEGALSMAADTQEDFTWPGPASAEIVVLDASGQGVTGMRVYGSPSGGGEGGTLSDGTTQIGFTYAIDVPVGPIQPDDTGGSLLTCTTDATGHCSLPTVLGAHTAYSTDTYQVVPGDPSYPSETASANAQITADPTLVTLNLIDPSSLVEVHGTISDVSGPAVGTVVTASSNDGSTSTATTDATGAYTVHVLPGDTYIALTAGSATAALDHLASLAANSNGALTTNADTQEDFTWPGPATAQVAVLDSTGHGVAGVAVNTPASSGGDAGTLSDGTTDISFYYELTVPVGPQPDDTGGPTLTCTTDAAGHCSLPTVVGTDSFYSTDPYQVVPGDPSYPSLTASTEGVITADPTPVTLTFVNLGSVASVGIVQGTVLAVSPDGTSITDMSNAAIAGNVLPNGDAVVIGALSYVVHVDPGGSVDVKLKLPAGSAATAVFKLQNGAYVDVSSISTIVGDTITMHLVDGGVGDSDHVQNGLIVDPIIPVRPPSGPPPQVSNFSPSKGPIGSSVTITGTGFTRATTVRFGSTPAASFSIVSDKKIVAIVGPGTTTGAISVAGPGGVGTSSKAFQVTAPPVPVVSNFNPPKGPAGTVVTISGSGFTGATAVRFNGVNATSFVVVADGTITAVVAPGTTSGPISVSTAGGTGISGKSYKVT